jgi:hypothetical protein
MNGYGSHLPILEVVYEHIPRGQALEFGCGLRSTPWLLNHFATLMSVETDIKWIAETVEHIEEKPRRRWNYMIMGDELEYFFEALDHVDLVLVDGANIKMRRTIAQTVLCLGMAKVLVLHDSEQPCFGYNQLMIPDGWTLVQCKHGMPWTAVLTKDPALIADLKKQFTCDVYTDTHAWRRITYTPQ